MEGLISYFDGPISNLFPRVEIDILQAYRVITGNYLKAHTARLRAARTGDEAARIKRSLPYVCFSGTFRSRRDDELITKSGFFCIDLDHVPQFNRTWAELIKKADPVLMFRSPSGQGIKAVVKVDRLIPHHRVFSGISEYVRREIGLSVDPATKNISRACFLCHDPGAYINPDGRLFDLTFVERYEAKPISQPINHPARIASSDQRATEVFNKVCKWADLRSPYYVGGRHRHKLLILGALSRQGVPLCEAVDMLYNRCIRTGVPTESKENFLHMAKRIYNYKTTACQLIGA